jgi:hypothetical protein
VLFMHAIQVILRHGAGEDPPTDDFTHLVVRRGPGPRDLRAAGVRDPRPHHLGARLRAALLAVLDAIPQKTRWRATQPRAASSRSSPSTRCRCRTGIDGHRRERPDRRAARGRRHRVVLAPVRGAVDPRRRVPARPTGCAPRARRRSAQRLEQDARSGCPIETMPAPRRAACRQRGPARAAGGRGGRSRPRTSVARRRARWWPAWCPASKRREG